MIRKARAKPWIRRKSLWFVLFIVGGVLLLWLGSGLLPVSPQFHFLLVEKNDETLRLINGDRLQLHPQDSLKILQVSTNITFNLGVRLASNDFDVTALRYEKLPISALLPSSALLSKNDLRVTVKRYNTDMGSVNFLVEPYVEDWLDKVNRTIDPERRLEILEQAVEFAPGDKRIKLRLVQEYQSLKKWPKAAGLLEAMTKEDADPKLLLDLLDVYESMGNPNGVISVLKRLLEKDPTSVELRFRLARALEKSDKRDEAIKQYENLLDRVPPAERVTIYKTLGYLYSKGGETEKAITTFIKALDLDKKDVNLYYNLAALYEKIGDKEKAGLYLGEALKLKPEDVGTRLTLAEQLMNEGNLPEAENHLTRVLQVKPDSLKALTLMANVLEKRGDKKKLKEVYERLLSQDPRNETLIYNLGVLEYETGNFSKSISYFEKLAKAHPQEVAPHRFLFDLYKREKKDDLAFGEAKTLMALNPKEAGSYYFAFEYLNTRGNFKEMLEIMKTGVQHLPDNVDLRQYLIFAYLRTGNDAPALQEMNELLKLKPKDVPLLLQVAKLCEKEGKSKEALAAYKRILEISPDHEEAEEAYLRLRLQELPQEQRKE